MKQRKKNITMLKKSWKFPFPMREARENSISHRLPLALRMELLNEITHCPVFIFHFFLISFLFFSQHKHTACGSRPFRLLHLDSSWAWLWRMGFNFGHLLLLHWSLHSYRRISFGAYNELFRVLLGINGTRCSIVAGKYSNIRVKSVGR